MSSSIREQLNKLHRTFDSRVFPLQIKGPETVRVGHVILIEDRVAKDLLGDIEGPALEATSASESLMEEMMVYIARPQMIST